MSDQLHESLDEIKCGLAELRLSTGKIETVVRMNIAEQKRINDFVCRDVTELQREQRRLQEKWVSREESLRQTWDRMEKNMESRIRRVDTRFAFFAGGLAVLVFIFNAALRYFTE